ncbi:hypothetical protein Goarm_014359, partial [Gossypium armourianum]|nr:hypothetical protein [Gossypium armourianum]
VVHLNKLEKYFGLPPIVGRNKKRVVLDLRDRVQNRIFVLECTDSLVGGKEDVWLALHYVSSGNNEQINFHKWLSWMFENHSVNKRTEIAVVLKAIWYARNKLLHEGTNQRVEDLVAFVRGYYAEIKALAKSIYRSPPPQIRRTWTNYGVCSRLTLQLPIAFAREALAAVHGLRFALEIGFLFVILESGSKLEAKELSKLFVDCQFNFIARLGNQAAHAMAQDGMRRMEDCFWVEEALVLVTTAVDEERRLLDQP